MFKQEFIALLEESIGKDHALQVLDALAQDPSVSIRLHPGRLRHCPFPEAVPIPWSPWGYLLKERPVFTLDPLFHAGGYYPQDSSAMFVGALLRALLPSLREGVRILDLCAAPGGKTTDFATILTEAFGERFSLLSNEVIRGRRSVLRSNVRTWGCPRVGVISRDPSAFGTEPLFDVVAADVPCSGEGMFRKDEKAAEDWSSETVHFCTNRSRRILSDIWPTLRPGGYLILSTCTFNHFENDDTLLWAASTLGGKVLDFGPMAPSVRTPGGGYVLLPGLVPGEGQYAAVLQKNGEEPLVGGDIFRLFRAEIPAEPLPDYPRWELSRQEALRYLHGDALRLQGAPQGMLTLTYSSLPLGPGKNLGSRCNNLYPKDRRIRMDV